MFFFLYSRIWIVVTLPSFLECRVSLLRLSCIRSWVLSSMSLFYVLPVNSFTILSTPPLGQDMTQGQFLSGVLQVWIQSFPSPRPVAEEPSLPYCLPIAGGRIIEFIPFQGYLCYVKGNQSRPGFELMSPYPFPTTITITPRAQITVI